MHFSLSTLVLLFGTFITASQAWTALDSCQPAEDAYKQAQHIKRCLLVPELTSDKLVVYNCYENSQLITSIIVRFTQNDMEIVMTRPAKSSFTLHGKCMQKGKQVGHVDVHIGAPAPWAPHFQAFNRVCDLNKGDEIELYWYKSTNTQIADCVKRPLHPIG